MEDRDAEPALTIIIPVHNESGAILPLLAEIHGILRDKLDYELVVVDDASEDGTAEELSTARHLLSNLRVASHSRRKGQSSALVTGVGAARTPWVMTMDGDGQNDPKDVLKLWNQHLENPETGMICGLRLARRDTWAKRVASRVANGVRSWILGDGVADTGCGLKLFPRALFLSLPAFDHMHRFLPALVQAQGRRVETVAVHHRPRLAGRSKYGILGRLSEGVLDLLGVWWLLHRSISRDSSGPLEGGSP